MTMIDRYIMVLPAFIAGIVLIIFSIVKKRRGLRVGLDAVFIAYCACVIGILYFPFPELDTCYANFNEALTIRNHLAYNDHSELLTGTLTDQVERTVCLILLVY